MSFIFRGTFNSNSGPLLRREILGNSVTFTEADSLKLSSGFLVAGTAGALVYGHLRAISTELGVGVNTTGAAGAAMGSFVGSYLTASDNQTVGKVKGEVDISKMSIVQADFETAIGTTTGSNLAGYFCDLDSATQLDESDTTTTTMQYALHGVDPIKSSCALANIYESQVFGV